MFTPIPVTNFQEDIKNNPPTVNNTVPFPTFDILNKNYFRSSIVNYKDMDEASLSVLIKNSIDTIVADISNNNIKDIIYLFKDAKFISALNRALNSIPITYEIKLAFNKIVYDYFTSDNPEYNIKKLYLNTSQIINREAINKLQAIGLSETIACNLALCRYSSANEQTNVKRLNFAIYARDPMIMNEQMIIWIYEKLFDRFYDLFAATMFETYSIQQQEDFGENFMEVYGTVDLAILCILNNMTSEKIRKVLMRYSDDWQYKGKPPVRFSLHCLSEDCFRIKRVLETLAIQIP